MDFMISSTGCAWDLQCFNGSCMCFIDEKLSLGGLVIYEFPIVIRMRAFSVLVRCFLHIVLHGLQSTCGALLN